MRGSLPEELPYTMEALAVSILTQLRRSQEKSRMLETIDNTEPPTGSE